jgi:hypothetical protein
MIIAVPLILIRRRKKEKLSKEKASQKLDEPAPQEEVKKEVSPYGID